MAFYQKYRSKTFAELIGQDHVAKTLLQGIKSDKLVHAYLLTGPRGIGKTSTARLLAKAINCKKLHQSRQDKSDSSGEPCNECDSCLEISEGKSLDVIEIDAASHTGVDDVRDLIDKARLSPTKSFKKIYIIDEVHMLSKSAFNALLKTLEEPPSHVVFIMATTEVHKIPATILSRVQRLDLHRATKADLVLNLKRVVSAESIEIDDQSLDLIAVAAAGGHRDALGLLEQVASAQKKVDIKVTRLILGIPEEREILLFLGAIFNNNPEEGLKIARRLFDSGHDLVEFGRKAVEMLRKIMLQIVGGDQGFEDTAGNLAEIQALASKTTLRSVVHYLDLFIEATQSMKDFQYPLLPLEIAVVKATGGQKTEIVPPPAVVQPVVSPPKVESIETKKIEIPVAPEKAISAPESEMVPVPVLDMTKDIWEQIIQKTKTDNSTLAALLRDAKPEQLTADTMTLGVKFKFHKDKISEDKNLKALEKVVSEVTGFPYKVVCKIASAKPKNIESDEKIDLEKAVTEVFEV